MHSRQAWAKKWRFVSDATILETAALSLDLDPDEVRQGRPPTKLRERMELLQFVCGRNRPIPFISAVNAYGNEREPRISLKDFATWARDEGILIPKELEDIAKKPSRSQLEEEVERLRAELSGHKKFDDAGPHYPPELDIACQAWDAVRKQTQSKTGSPRKSLEEWVKKNYGSRLRDEAINRIAIVANWDKSPGRPKRKPTE